MNSLIKKIQNLPYEAGLALRYPKIIPVLETLNILKEEKKSLARFGDGEFNLIFGLQCRFEDPDTKLANDLLKVIQLEDENVLIGIPDIFKSLKNYLPASKKYWTNYLINHRSSIYKILFFNRTYCDALVTRPFAKTNRTVAESAMIFEQWKQIWRDRKIVVVTGDRRYTAGSSGLFDDASQLEIVYTEPSHAYVKHQDILKNIRFFDKNKLILLILGPTATILVPKLAKDGYQALDIGHLENEYITFLSETKGKLIDEMKA